MKEGNQQTDRGARPRLADPRHPLQLRLEPEPDVAVENEVGVPVEPEAATKTTDAPWVRRRFDKERPR